MLDYATDGGCDVVRLGDTRLGDDATEIFRMARGIEARTPGEALMKTLTVLNLVVCDYTAPAPVHAFAGHDTGSILYTETPLRIDTAEVDPHGVVYVSRSEVATLRNVELEVIAATSNSACESPRSACSGSDSSNVTTTNKADRGILDYDCIAATQ